MLRRAIDDVVVGVESFADCLGGLKEVLHESSFIQIENDQGEFVGSRVLPFALLERVGAWDDVGDILDRVPVGVREEVGAGHRELDGDIEITLHHFLEVVGLESADDTVPHFRSSEVC